MIRSATSGDAARLMDLWRAAGLRFHPGLVERELASVVAQDLALADEEAGKLTGTVFGTYDGTRGWIHRLAPAGPARPRHRLGPARRARAPSARGRLPLATVPASARWRDIWPELSAEPYVFAAGEPAPGSAAT